MVEFRRIIPILIATLSLFSCASPQQKSSGASHVKYNHNTFDIYIANYPKDTIQLYWKDEKGQKLTSLSNLKAYVERGSRKLIFATNAGMYMPDNSPEGLYIEQGKELMPINLKSSDKSNFYLQPNGIFLLTKTAARVIPTADFEKYRNETLFATQSGPMLVINGQINPKFTKGSENGYIRSGVGINKEGKVVFAISDELVNFYDFADFFKNQLRCDNALFLDGAISRMFLPEINRNDLDGNFGAMIGITVLK